MQWHKIISSTGGSLMDIWLSYLSTTSCPSQCLAVKAPNSTASAEGSQQSPPAIPKTSNRHSWECPIYNTTCAWAAAPLLTPGEGNVPKASPATSRKRQTKDLPKNWDQNAFVFKYLEAFFPTLFFFSFFFCFSFIFSPLFFFLIPFLFLLKPIGMNHSSC